MTVTVQDVMRQMRNYFIASTLTGTFTVADGIIDLDPPLAPGAWVAIEGSGAATFATGRTSTRTKRC